MFASLLASRKDPRSETTPLLQALDSYRRRHADLNPDPNPNGHPDDDAAHNPSVPTRQRFPRYQEHDDDDDENEDSDGRRGDGPLLPVFSAEFLGTCLLLASFARGPVAPRRPRKTLS